MNDLNPTSDEPPSLGRTVSCFILSGGSARRAEGKNKSFLIAEGEPILDQQIHRLRPSFHDGIFILTDRSADFEGYNLICMADPPLPGLGDLRCGMRGLYSALSLSPTPWVFVLACDMPFPDMEIAQSLIQGLSFQAREMPTQFRGICLRGAKGPEPFHAIYHQSLAEDLRLRLTASGDLSLQNWIRSEPRILLTSGKENGTKNAAISRCLQNFNQSL